MIFLRTYSTTLEPWRWSLRIHLRRIEKSYSQYCSRFSKKPKKFSTTPHHTGDSNAKGTCLWVSPCSEIYNFTPRGNWTPAENKCKHCCTLALGHYSTLLSRQVILSMVL